jgi:hypothetical protein
MGKNIIRLTTEAELQSVQKETIINKSTKITKVSDNSVLSGMAAGNAKVAKKAIKDIALAVSHLFPDSASGVTLDQVADNHGIAGRLGASQSSTYIRLIADNGTTYIQGTHTFKGASGVLFDLDEASVAVGTKGYIYAKVRSQATGQITNVNPYIINTVTPAPSGHVGVINEYAATGGRDIESDELFRRRIKEGQAQLSQKTLAYLEQAFMTINSDVLRIIFEGIDQSGKVVLAIVTQNGIDLTVNELATLLDQGSEYFALTEMLPVGNPPEATAVILKNVEYQNIDLDFRWSLFDSGLLDATVKEIQVQFAKYVDFRFWDSSTDRVEWDDLLGIIKNTDNVKYVPDTLFTPSTDIIVDRNKLPRFRGFIARDLDGAVLVNQAGTIDPTFYPAEVNGSLAESVL